MHWQGKGWSYLSGKEGKGFFGYFIFALGPLQADTWETRNDYDHVDIRWKELVLAQQTLETIPIALQRSCPLMEGNHVPGETFLGFCCFVLAG